MLSQRPSLTLVSSSLPLDLPPSLPPHPSPLPSIWTSSYHGPLKRSHSTGPLPSKTDVVIIGSGITGSCVAARLVEGWLERRRGIALGEDAMEEKELDVVVLEAREFCSGATGRNGSHLTPAPMYHFKTISELHSVENAKRSVLLEDRAADWVTETCAAEGWEDDVDLVRGGNVHLFGDQAAEDAVREQVDAASAAGLAPKITWLSAEQALAEYGAVTFSAARIPGNNLFPLKFVANVFTRAQRQCEGKGVGLELYTSTMVNSVVPTKSSSTGAAPRWTVKTSRGDVSATHVIHATNAYASHLLPHLSSGPHCIVPTRGQVLSLVPSPLSNPHWTTAFSSDHSSEMYYFQRPNGGPVILGGARAFARPKFEFGTVDDGSVSEVVGRPLREYLGEQFPRWFGEKEGEVESEWCGIMGYRPSGDPLVGQVFVEGKPLPGQFVSAGYSGHGMTRAPACAEIIASMVLGDITGDTFVLPDWFPTNYVSTAEASSEMGMGPEAKAHVETAREGSSWRCVVS